MLKNTPRHTSIASSTSGVSDEAASVEQIIKRRTPEAISYLEQAGFQVEQVNGQRRSNHVHYSKLEDCNFEVYVSSIPRDAFEDELLPILLLAGRVSIIRFLIDFSGTGRGYCFVCYASQEEGENAIRLLNGYQMRPNEKPIKVEFSFDNRKLHFENLPPNYSRSKLLEELNKVMHGVKDVSIAGQFNDKQSAIVTFNCHDAATAARRLLLPGNVKIGDSPISVSWVKPDKRTNYAASNNNTPYTNPASRLLPATVASLEHSGIVPPTSLLGHGGRPSSVKSRSSSNRTSTPPSNEQLYPIALQRLDMNNNSVICQNTNFNNTSLNLNTTTASTASTANILDLYTARSAAASSYDSPALSNDSFNSNYNYHQLNAPSSSFASDIFSDQRENEPPTSLPPTNFNDQLMLGILGQKAKELLQNNPVTAVKLDSNKTITLSHLFSPWLDLARLKFVFELDTFHIVHIERGTSYNSVYIEYETQEQARLVLAIINWNPRRFSKLAQSGFALHACRGINY